MPYISNTDDDRRDMLRRIGVDSIEHLLDGIPENLRLNRPLDISALSEMELLIEVEELSRESHDGLTCFAGGGVYDHFIPAAVGSIISRPEFMTAYTPYQPEVSQGTLQVTYEFQTHICRLTGMEIANASLYDGASAAAEAILLAVRVTKRDKAVISSTVSPLYRQVIDTYLAGRGIELVYVPMQDGVTDYNRMQDVIDENTACVLVSQPNFFGLLEEVERVIEPAQEVGAKTIMAVDPIAQAILKTPGEYGADMVVGEGQPLGIPVSFGGPLLGFFATSKKLIRQVPGRIVSRTTDVDGRTGFVLTLQTREQHIRREKATSNICTNQALCATAASVYMTLMGKQGMRQVALLSAEKAQKTYEQITSLDGFSPYFEAPFLREFAIKTPEPASEIISALTDKGLLAGINAGRWYDGLDDCLIVAVTEKRSDQDIARLVEGLKERSTSGVMSKM
jgi:glycine dehydrogenase subunit 1